MHGIAPAMLAGKRGYLPVYPLGPNFKNPKWVQIGLYSNTGLGIQTGAGPTPARIEVIIHTAEMRD